MLFRDFIFVVLSLLFFSCSPALKNQNNNLSDHGLYFDKMATLWDEAIPLGNGELGALVWKREGKLRFSLDRSDLWDLRPVESFNNPQFSYQWVTEQVLRGDYSPVQEIFDVPYNQLPAPSKIPGAALEFNISKLGKIQKVQLTVKNALCKVEWKNGIILKTFVQADAPVGWFKFENVNKDFVPEIIPPVYKKKEKSKVVNALDGQDLQRLGYEQGEVVSSYNKQVYRQKGWDNFEYEVAVEWKHNSKNELVGCWSISSTFSEKETGKSAKKVVEEFSQLGFEKAWENHLNWWGNFWSKSTIDIPDSVLENQWYLEQYKFGSAARANTPPISLQAVWTADNGKLPPWKGDFHHDLNTQLSYWPAYSGNHLDLEEGFLNWLWKCRETFKQYTKNYFETNGINVPGVTTLEGQPMGGWIQYSFGPTVSAWLGQHFYLHWKYSMDNDFLKERAYPWIKDVAIYLDEISEKKADGTRKLPISSSPEINDNRIDAWFTETTNFDLALIKFTYEKAAEMATELEYYVEAKKWESVLNEWPDLAVAGENGGLAFAPDYPYQESHRHFSHLMAWHPLGIVDWSGGEKEQQIIIATLKDLEKYGSDWWTGYSFSWLGNLYARAFMGEKAAETLRIFAENFCLPNSFHVNGEQHNRGYSKFKYRPFTLEGNFAFASGIQEMLIQSHTGTIKVLPAVPDNWQNISFKGLRAEGAFIFDAIKTSGKISSVKIHAEKGGVMQLENPFFPKNFKMNGGRLVEDGKILKISTDSGETVLLNSE